MNIGIHRATATPTLVKPLGVVFLPLLHAQRAFHPPTADHGERVGRLARLIALESGRVDPELAQIAGELHDIGKLSISRERLDPGAGCYETHADWLEGHSRVGAAIVAAVESPVASAIAAAILAHHERADGTGYPQHLRGNSVDELGSIVGLADCVDALMGRGVAPRPDLCDEAVSIVGAIPEQFSPSLREWFRAAVTKHRAEFLEVAAASQAHPGPPPAL